MISSPFGYLFILASIGAFFSFLDKKSDVTFFKYVPPVVLVYASAMLLASMGFFERNQEVGEIYRLTKSNLLPAMLFLMLLQVDFKEFFRLGKSLIIAYILALISLGIAFVVVALVFDFNRDFSAAFGALAGSWMGGTANMIAVGSALGVSQEAFGYALIVDSVNYTLWVMLLLFLVPFASYFNHFTKSDELIKAPLEVGCACSMGAPKYWLLILLSIFASVASQMLAEHVEILNKTTTVVLMASTLGVLGSFSPLKSLNGSSQVATTMLYVLVALIGSQAVFDNFSSVGIYVVAGFCILILHAFLMVVGAKLFRLDLFSIAVASLANIGGVASAPILAAAYNKNLVSIGVLMAIIGYLVGTFGGLIVGNILVMLAG